MNNGIEKLELNKILSQVADYAVLNSGKSLILNLTPSDSLEEVARRLTLTAESRKLLYTYGISKIAEFDDISAELSRAKKGSALSCEELLNASALLRSARSAFVSISKTDDEEIKLIRRIADGIYFDENLENDISEKIISVDAVSDYASERLFSIRSKIKNLNERIRSKLSEYVSGKNAEYLQDGIVTLRNDRYVIPVKAEYKSRVRGFVHDRSKTGATFFIEPEYVLEMNNELIDLSVDEREEVENILKGLSKRLGAIAESLNSTAEILAELDSYYAIAEYSYFLKCTKPKLNDRGFINIIKGRHPLISKETVVPISVELGSKYDFLLLSGANTGGKTVTLKTCGLFCLMAACGLFIPAEEGSEVSVFNAVYCDIGDSQSIEQSLSTFSSHITNIIEICRKADERSLVLIDEPGGGTNPDEGQALAKAVVKRLLDRRSKGIITTHFTSLKEFAYSTSGIENACMEFDADTLKPLYRIKIGLPGSSNALAICRRLGMDEGVLADAESYLSDGARSYENIVRRAEQSRVEADERLAKANAMQQECKEKLDLVNRRIDELNREKEKIGRSARTESRRIIAERTERAEDILSEMEEIFKKEELTESDLIAARTLKNKLVNIAYDEEEDEKKITDFPPATKENLKVGAEVFIKPMECKGTVESFNSKKDEAEILCGSMKTHIKLKDLLVIGVKPAQKQKSVKVIKKVFSERPILEINVLGLTVPEALYEVDNFIDRAVTDNLEEIKVIHGLGTGKLKKAIHERLRHHPNVESFRSGVYGEGETGVTFIKLK